MNIVAFGASSSSTSINKQLAVYATSFFENANKNILDLNDYEMPIYSMDREKEHGIPVLAKNFVDDLSDADLIIISMAEHNGSYTAAFKNVFDWASRHKGKVFEGKKLLLLSTSTGARGGIGALETAKNRFPFHGAEILATFSLPKFEENFNTEKGIIDQTLLQSFQAMIAEIAEKI